MMKAQANADGRDAALWERSANAQGVERSAWIRCATAWEQTAEANGQGGGSVRMGCGSAMKWNYVECRGQRLSAFHFHRIAVNFSKLAFMAASVSVAIAFSTGRSLHSPLPGDSERVQLYRALQDMQWPSRPAWINTRSRIRKGIRLSISGSESAQQMFARKH